ncbi:MAG TPA: class I SAM-dependent methyltransferase, partial [Thermoanaerobaculia bacterium]|nr:class I SAM-dependent methyltransferase [Thermoanaerobaculia bacterium]
HNTGMADVVFSAYALHHLGRPDKERVLREVVELLVAGGWFINADLIVADSPELESRLQELRVAGMWNARVARTTDSLIQHRRAGSWLISNVRKLINHSPLLRI